MSVSVADLKKNYQNLNVEFDLWKGESDAQPYIPDMIRELKEKGMHMRIRVRSSLMFRRRRIRRRFHRV